MSDVVLSINIMCGILIIGVSYCIYWIFTYDDRYPNPATVSEHEPDSEPLIDESRRSYPTDERVEVRTESYAH